MCNLDKGQIEDLLTNNNNNEDENNMDDKDENNNVLTQELPDKVKLMIAYVIEKDFLEKPNSLILDEFNRLYNPQGSSVSTTTNDGTTITSISLIYFNPMVYDSSLSLPSELSLDISSQTIFDNPNAFDINEDNSFYLSEQTFMGWIGLEPPAVKYAILQDPFAQTTYNDIFLGMYDSDQNDIIYAWNDIDNNVMKTDSEILNNLPDDNFTMLSQIYPSYLITLADADNNDVGYFYSQMINFISGKFNYSLIYNLLNTYSSYFGLSWVLSYDDLTNTLGEFNTDVFDNVKFIIDKPIVNTGFVKVIQGDSAVMQEAILISQGTINIAYMDFPISECKINLIYKTTSEGMFVNGSICGVNIKDIININLSEVFGQDNN